MELGNRESGNLGMKESSANTLFHLLRAGLGNEAAGSELPSDINWQEVIDLSFEQNVAAIAVDGLDKIRSSIDNDNIEWKEKFELLNSEDMENLKYMWFAEFIRCKEKYKEYKSKISGFIKLCKPHKVLLLKGYGLSLNYPIPSHRPCGDIDVFLFGEGESINQIVEKQLDISIDRSNPHHSVFACGGFTFENHNTILDVKRHKNQCSDEQMFQELITEGCDEVEVGGERCFIPSVKMNSVYLLRHMAHHFAVERITLRHILDWALFVKANASKIDWDFVYGFAKDSGCTPFLNCLNGICVESLGFAAEDFPVRMRDGKLQSRMLADILSPEFKEEIPDSTHTLRYAIAKTRRILANRWKYRMVSDERIGVTIWNLAKERLKCK